MDLLYGVFNLGFDLIMGAFAAFGNGILAVMNSVWNMMLGGLEGALNKAVDLINMVINAMNMVPNVNIPLVAKVSFERGTAGTITAPTLAGLTGGKLPSELIGESLAGVAEEEEMTTSGTTGTVASALGASLSGSGDVGVDQLISGVSSQPVAISQSIVIPVQIDGYEVGKAVYNSWNGRTGGGLNI